MYFDLAFDRKFYYAHKMKDSFMKTRSNFSLTRCCIGVTIALSLTACGGGSSDSSKDAAPKTAVGYFVDAGVEGIEVLQNNKSLGKTGKQGTFTYVIGGGSVTFKLGELVLGSIMPKAIVTPADLTIDSNQLTRSLQILQTIDTDNNLNNGIQIAPEIAQKFVVADFERLLKQTNDANFTATLQAKIGNKTVQTPTAANEHFKQTLAQLPNNDLSKIADNFVGYWEQSCDEGSQEVFQLVKSSSNPAMLQSTGTTITRTYQNNNCTGSYTSGQYDSSKEPFNLTVMGKAVNGSNQTVVNIQLAEPSGSSNSSVTWTDSNTFTDGDLTFKRRSTLAFGDSTNTTNSQEIEKAVNSLVGYWQTGCQTEQHSDGTTTSYRNYIQTTKVSTDTLGRPKYLTYDYQSANCSGTPEVITYTNKESRTLTDPKFTNGSWNFGFTNSSNTRLTMVDANNFIVGENKFTRTTQSAFDTLWQQATNTTSPVQEITNYLNNKNWLGCISESNGSTQVFAITTVSGTTAYFKPTLRKLYATNNCTGSVLNQESLNQADTMNIANATKQNNIITVLDKDITFKMNNSNNFTVSYIENGKTFTESYNLAP